jgi:hypothetical protein
MLDITTTASTAAANIININNLRIAIIVPCYQDAPQPDILTFLDHEIRFLFEYLPNPGIFFAVSCWKGNFVT